jgi:division protein CdvB (Snf7/Vps24/ESCRT-III family)
LERNKEKLEKVIKKLEERRQKLLEEIVEILIKEDEYWKAYARAYVYAREIIFINKLIELIRQYLSNKVSS